MLAKDVQIVDIAADHVEHLGELMRRGKARRPDGVILFYEENRVLHAVHTRKGPMELRSFEGPRRLGVVADAEKVEFVLALERGAVRRMAAAAQSRIRWDDPFTLQVMALLTAFRMENGHTIHVYPEPKKPMPKPGAWAVRWARRLLRREKLFALIVYNDAGDGVWFSAITKWKEAEVTLLTTVESLHEAPLENGTPAKRNARMLERIREVWGPVAGAVFMERAVFAHIVNSERPLSALRRAIRSGWAQARPFPLLWRVVLWAARWKRV